MNTPELKPSNCLSRLKKIGLKWSIFALVFSVQASSLFAAVTLTFTSTSSTFTPKITFTGTPTLRSCYLDTDINATTGYPISGRGANYLLEEGSLYRYTGSGGSWNWTFVKAITTSSTSTTYSWTVPRMADVGNPIVVYGVGQTQAPITLSSVVMHALYYSNDFATNWSPFGEQSFQGLPRASLVTVGGKTSVRLHTEPGDNNVFGSLTNERNDLVDDTQDSVWSDATEGKTAWWSHSVYFPNDFVIPPAGGTWDWNIIADFHNSASGQANVQFLCIEPNQPSGGLEFWIVGGDPLNPAPQEKFPIGPVVKNVWHEITYHVKWSSGSDGFINGWYDGVQKMCYSGPTLYIGQYAYFKLANYHTPNIGPVSVNHTRVRRGTTEGVVSSLPLEEVFTFEGEDLAVSASSGDALADYANVLDSGGYFTHMASNAIGDFVTYTVNVPVAGNYRVKVTPVGTTNRGKFQLSIDGVNQGPIVDTYTPAASHGVVYDLGTKNFTSSGNKAFKFTITGKNAASTGYQLSTDVIKLTVE